MEFAVDAIDTQQVGLHRKGKHLFITQFVDHDGFQKTGIDDVKHFEWLTDCVNALAGFELDMLEKDFFICHCRIGRYRDAQQSADIFQVGPEFSIFLSSGFHRGGF